MTRPDLAARVLGAPRRDSHPVLRILGLRHLLEAAALASRPTSGVVAAGLAVDGTHVLSCLGLAAVSPSHRRPAFRDAVAGSTILIATWLLRPRPVQTGHPTAVPARASGTPPKGPRLVFVAGGQAPAGSQAASGIEEFVPLAAGVETIVGRSRDADIVIGDAAASPRHLAVVADGQGHTRLRDLGSQNGTTVNGVPVVTATLHDGDRINLGASALVYRCTPTGDPAGS
ncbi:MAG: hypothetical protein NVSMB55_13180 [Mycobacteriales bacterium]